MLLARRNAASQNIDYKRLRMRKIYMRLQTARLTRLRDQIASA